MSPEQPQTLLHIVGPPAVGKMAVGYAIEERTGLRLFHNHLTIEPVLRFFQFGTPAYCRLVDEFRSRIMEEVAASDLPGLIFTFVWAFDDPEDAAIIERYSTHFRARGGRVLIVELEAPLEVRLQRNESELRLREKPSKRHIPASRQNVIDVDGRYRLNSNGEFDGRADYLRIDNTTLSTAAAAERVIDHFELARTAR